MNPYDREKTREIWQRVLGETVQEPQELSLTALCRTEQADAAALYRHAARYGGETGARLRQAAQAADARAKKCALLAFLETGERVKREHGQDALLPLPELLRGQILSLGRLETAYAAHTERGAEAAALRKSAAESRERLMRLLERIM